MVILVRSAPFKTVPTDDFSEINHRLGTTTQMRTRTKHPEKRPKEKKEKGKNHRN